VARQLVKNLQNCFPSQGIMYALGVVFYSFYCTEIAKLSYSKLEILVVEYSLE
jgi:hypothetical protein